MELYALLAADALLCALLVWERLDRRRAERNWDTERTKLVDKCMARNVAEFFQATAAPPPPPPPRPPFRPPIEEPDDTSLGALSAGSRFL